MPCGLASDWIPGAAWYPGFIQIFVLKPPMLLVNHIITQWESPCKGHEELTERHYLDSMVIVSIFNGER